MIIFPELSLLGYPPFDLLKNRIIRDKLERALQKILEEKFSINILLGAPYFENNKTYDSVYWIKENKVIKRIDKFYFSNDPLGQNDYFSKDAKPEYIEINDKKIALLISDDTLFSYDFSGFNDYLKNSNLILIVSSSFYYFGKRKEKIRKNI